MELNYELHCLGYATFYDDPNLARNTNPDFPFARQPVPTGWGRAEFEHWVSYMPEGAALPPQGWKVHVATCLDNAEAVLAAVCDYCIPRPSPSRPGFCRAPPATTSCEPRPGGVWRSHHRG